MRAQRWEDGASVAAYAVEATSVHRHPEALEFVYAVRGEASVRVSSERYLLEEGDYALLNAGDTHVLEGDSLIVVLQIEIASFVEEFPQLEGAIFACESFDLPRFMGTETRVRERLLRVFLAAAEQRAPLVSELLGDMLEFYGVEHYYDRRRTLNQGRRSLLRTMTVLLRKYATERNVLDLVSEEMHYSKSALSRIARESTGMSFSDLLTNIRLWNAEVLLLETEDTMVSIAAACGFSDVKYFTRAFRSWFECTPSQYRRDNRGRVHGGESVETVSELPRELLEAHLGGALPTGRPTRRSVTPIDVVTGAVERSVLLDAADAAALEAEADPEFRAANRPHMMPIRADTEGFERSGWQMLLTQTDRSLYRPVLVVSAGLPEAATGLAADLVALATPDPEMWVSYRFGDERAAEQLSRELEREFGVTALPMLMG